MRCSPRIVIALRRSVSILALSTVLQGALLYVPAFEPTPANAQAISTEMLASSRRSPDAQMLLEADEVIYNNDNSTVAAIGNVQIAYDGHTLVAQRVTYSRVTGRVIAVGNVEILEPNGTRVFAEEIDITDDFSDGFVSSLMMETADNTRFAAESAERRDGEISVFNNGVYTACEPCKEDPQKPPLWQIRAKRVTLNKRTERVYYEGASFELFGRPIAYLPRFSHADPAIKRKTGFLIPSPSYTEELGFGIKNSFFWNIAPNADLTLSGTYYTNQGFLSDVEWRHRVESGQYSIRYANIHQRNPDDFKLSSVDSRVDDRSALMTSGLFTINPRWQFGWNWLYQTDQDFARTYGLTNYDSRDVTNEIYLTGLAGKNFFDLRTQKFLVQDGRADLDRRTPGNQSFQDQQGHALPSMDYNWVSDEPVAGGQVSVDVNVRNIHRHDPQVFNDNGRVAVGPRERFHGIAGDNGRATLATEWKRSEILNGSLVTASLFASGDGIWKDTEDLGSRYNPLVSNDSLWRGMGGGMLEIRYPLVATDGYATHLFEPIAQVIARPDETHIGDFPNEDAQSMVFDTTNLFERNKFSGYDRVEGGTRANVGFRYSASFQNGASLNVMAGQSYHLFGLNSYAQRDLVNAGLESGLETDKSDYVASAEVNNGHGLTFGVGGRFDESDLALRRGEVGTRYINELLSVRTGYVFIDSQPRYGYAERRHEANASASVKLTEYWRAFGSMSYDIEHGNLYSRGIGLAYDDSCFSFSVAYNETENRYDGSATGASVMFRIGLRTIGDANYKYSLNDNNE